MRKKITILAVLLCCIIVAVGCGNASEIQQTNSNPYFYMQDRVYLSAVAEYYNMEGDLDEEVLNLEIYKVKEYDGGRLYHLRIEPPQKEDFYIDDSRTNIYLYVTENKIYRVWSYIYEKGEMITFYDDDETASRVLDTEEKIIENAVVICQEEEMRVELEDGESGMQYNISKKDNMIGYYRWDRKVNGERGFYEWFVWEAGKGLVRYGSGFRAEADILYLDVVYGK